jgi:hypothetical protein
MDQARITQVIHTQVMDMGTMLTTLPMATIIQPHLICKTMATKTGILMLPPVFSNIGMAMFTGTTVLIENINRIPMLGCKMTTFISTIPQNILLEAQQERPEQTAQQERPEQTALEVLLLHHPALEGLAKEAERVVEGV